jgi:hypothetical protein
MREVHASESEEAKTEKIASQGGEEAACPLVCSSITIS